MRKVLDHWKKHLFYKVKSALQNWMMLADIQERQQQVKKEEGKLTDTSLAFD